MAMSVFSLPLFTDKTAAIEKLESIIWPNGPVCVHCGVAGRVGRLNGKSTKIGALKCYACRKKFHVTVGAVFEDSHVPLTYWMQAANLLVSSNKGFSSHQLMRALDVQYKTAWFMTHRTTEAMTEGEWRTIGKLGGEGQTVEADETWVGGNAANRAYGPIPPKHAVAALVERGGRVPMSRM
jgi:transposase-like protein